MAESPPIPDPDAFQLLAQLRAGGFAISVSGEPGDGGRKLVVAPADALKARPDLCDAIKQHGMELARMLLSPRLYERGAKLQAAKDAAWDRFERRFNDPWWLASPEGQYYLGLSASDPDIIAAVGATNARYVLVPECWVLWLDDTPIVSIYPKGMWEEMLRNGRTVDEIRERERADEEARVRARVAERDKERARRGGTTKARGLFK